MPMPMLNKALKKHGVLYTVTTITIHSRDNLPSFQTSEAAKVHIIHIKTDLQLAQFMVSTSAQFHDWFNRMIQPIIELHTCKNYKLC